MDPILPHPYISHIAKIPIHMKNANKKKIKTVHFQGNKTIL